MPEASNIMTVTNKGLSAVSGILINSYSYNGDITVIGNPDINSSGIASQLSSASYFERDNLELLDATMNSQEESEIRTVSIDFTGTFVSSETYSTAFCLTGEKSLSVFLNSTSLIVDYDEDNVMTLSGFNLSLSDLIHIILNINPNFISIEAIINGKSYFKQVEITTEASKFTKILVGSEYLGSENFWKGSINLSKFFIYQNKKLLYAPATKESVTFTSIVVSDVNFPLSDSSGPIIGASYEFPVEEISRTNNNVLLKANISSSAYLDIGNIGLYCRVAGKRFLFSSITGLNIRKGKDLPYELLFHVNLDINVVNTTVRPEIILREAEYSPQTYLEDIKKVILNSTIDIERCIKKNSIALGYNRPQVFYREEKYLQESIRGWTSITRLNIIRENMNMDPLLFYSTLGETLYSYKLFDLATSIKGKYLEFLDETFKGDDNTVSFSSDCTLSIVTYLTDIQDKIILAKINPDLSEIYFVLEFLNGSLKFTLYAEEDVYSFSYAITPEEQVKFLGRNLLSITKDEDSFLIYLGTELLGSVGTISSAYIDDSEGFYLTNYVNSMDEASVNFTDILFFNKAFTPSDIIKLLHIFSF